MSYEYGSVTSYHVGLDFPIFIYKMNKLLQQLNLHEQHHFTFTHSLTQLGFNPQSQDYKSRLLLTKLLQAWCWIRYCLQTRTEQVWWKTARTISQPYSSCVH